jgi:hypothetical protein
MESVAAWFTIVGVPVAVIGIVAAVLQLWQSNKFEQRRKRPYVSVRYAFDELANGRRCIVLIFQNYGVTPAKQVRLAFPEGDIWNHVRSNSDLPFLRSEGITTLYPNQVIKYLVADCDKKNPLEHLLTTHLEAQLSYSDGSKLYSETVLLGLEDYAYSVRNKQ